MTTAATDPVKPPNWDAPHWWTPWAGSTRIEPIFSLTSPDPTRPLFGPAVTIAYLPYLDDHPQTDFARRFSEAVGSVRAGAGADTLQRRICRRVYGWGIKLSRGEYQHIAGVLRRR
ncbi:hypothetical protein [Agromyces humatus]|uniref:Uncharacterized protein n=1 Tax=Agromyces humatus TaxID=279573 RepID=A0ABN2KHJ9_9MICO|nr:hypothetical protein [Agromyces humatus]